MLNLTEYRKRPALLYREGLEHFDSALVAVATDIAAIELPCEVVQSLLCQRQLLQLTLRPIGPKDASMCAPRPRDCRE